jgi:hypothetical protein
LSRLLKKGIEKQSAAMSNVLDRWISYIRTRGLQLDFVVIVIHIKKKKQYRGERNHCRYRAGYKNIRVSVIKQMNPIGENTVGNLISECFDRSINRCVMFKASWCHLKFAGRHSRDHLLVRNITTQVTGSVDSSETTIDGCL